jgi:hypothetical protein
VKLTKKQRAEVVELLRCAADLAANGNRDAALGCAARHLDMTMSYPLPVDDPHWAKYLRGDGPVQDQPDRGWWICGPNYHLCLPEAAARVEEGSWP